MRNTYLYKRFQENVRQRPKSIAISAPHANITFEELERSSNRIGASLAQSGVGRGDVIGVLTSDRTRIVEAMIGVLKAGCAFLTLDPTHPSRFREQQIALAAPTAILVDDTWLPMAAAATEARAISFSEIARAGDASFTPIDSEPDDFCYIYFTSGSTGAPKAIAGRLCGVDHFIHWEVETFGLSENVRVSQLTSPSFDAFLRDVFVPLCAGGRLCITDSPSLINDGERLAEWLERAGITLMHCVPSVFRSLCNSGLAYSRLPDLKRLILAGEVLLPSDVDRWMEIFGERMELVNMYGTSETTMAKLWHTVTPEDRNAAHIPIGKPLPGAAVIVLDAQHRVCAPDVVGEIYLRTRYMSLGYYRQPELMREVFLPNPLTGDPNDIVYRTGDLGKFREDGELMYLGRRDQQVKIRGVRIELSAIENELRSHALVNDVAVIPQRDGEGQEYLCAYLLLATGATTAEVRSFLDARLPEYMRPSRFIAMEAFPRTSNGKTDRLQLPLMAAAVEESEIELTPIEDGLRKIWLELIDVPAIALDSDFFMVGGHSLMAPRMLSLIRARYGVQVPLGVFLLNPSIRALAVAVEEAVLQAASDEDLEQELVDMDVAGHQV